MVLHFVLESGLDANINITCILSHREGHREEVTLPLPLDTGGAKSNVQAAGSTISYGKRYTLCAILNLSTRGEDDDAQSTEARLTPFQSNQILKILHDCSDTTQEWFAGQHGTPENVLHSQFTALLEKLKQARAKTEASNENS